MVDRDGDQGLRIVFFGTPEFAVPSLRHMLGSRHRVVAVVTQPDRPRGRGQRIVTGPVKTVAIDHHIPVLQPERLKPPDFLDHVRSLGADLGVVVAYGRILPQALLDLPSMGFINVHASLLPRYRGAAPVHRAVMAGERETGVTIMRVVLKLDAGPMLARRTRPIDPNETSDDVERDLGAAGAELLMETLEAMVSGVARETPQEEQLATYAPPIVKSEGLIDWHEPAHVIHNRVRGLYPWPHAYTFAGPLRCVILRTIVAPDATLMTPGTVALSKRDTISVACGDGTVIQILSLQPEGKRPMDARDFLAGHGRSMPAQFGGPPR